MNKNLIRERMNPQPITNHNIQPDEFNKAWNWMTEKDTNGNLVRMGMALIVIHDHSLRLRRQGVGNSAEVAAVEIWKRCRESEPVTSTKAPIRRNPPLVR